MLTAIVVVAYVILQQGTTAVPASKGTVIGFALQDRAAPGFDLPRLQGRGSVTLDQLRGKPIVLNFWSSTCEVCKKESPAIARVARATGTQVTYIGIDTLDERAAALGFVRHYGISYQIAFDSTGATAAQYGVPGLPVTFFLAKSGKRIIGVNIGALTSSSLRRILHELYGLT